MPVSSEAKHPDPVWRDRSNFIIGADISSYSDKADREQLWARQVDENRFELCCIPFFLYDVTLGDVVETKPAGGRTYMLHRVVEPSGRYVFRVWFGDAAQLRDGIEAALRDLDALLEWGSPNLVAVDARNADHAQQIADYLAAAEEEGRLVYETGRTA